MKKIMAIGTVLLFLIIMFCGCEELEDFKKPDYINIFVNCEVDVVLFPKMESMDNPQTFPAKYLQLNVEIIKAGGERVDGVVSTDANGRSGPVSASFKL